MKTLRLQRFQNDHEGTIGLLTYQGKKVCLIAELMWRDNHSNISCIPAGRYIVHYMPRSGSGRYRDVYHVQDVQGRSGILQHPGNLTGRTDMGLKTHSHGCQLPGMRIGRIRGQRAVLGSKKALNAIHKITNRQSYILEIYDV